MKLDEISYPEFRDCYEQAHAAMECICSDVNGMDSDDPWHVESFTYYVLSTDDGTIVAERHAPHGPREPDFIWSAGIVNDCDARWFTSEDARDDNELELGHMLNSIAPGGIGGW